MENVQRGGYAGPLKPQSLVPVFCGTKPSFVDSKGDDGFGFLEQSQFPVANGCPISRKGKGLLMSSSVQGLARTQARRGPLESMFFTEQSQALLMAKEIVGSVFGTKPRREARSQETGVRTKLLQRNPRVIFEETKLPCY